MRSFAEKQFDLPTGAFPFESHFLEIGQTRLHYIREGRGPTLLFLHGNPTWSFLYRNIIHDLSEAYDCIALDLPGFGLSTPPEGYGFTPEEHANVVAQFLEQTGIQDACLIAHDWGGPIGLWSMQNTENRITRFCLGNTWAWPVNGIFHFEWFARLMGGAIGRWANERHALFVNRVIPASMKRGAPDPLTMQAYRAPFEPPVPRTPLHIFPRHILQSKLWLADIEQGLKAYKGRCAFIWPQNDIAFRAKELQRWQKLLPQAQITQIENCGHYLWEDAPEEARKALNHHLKHLTA